MDNVYTLKHAFDNRYKNMLLFSLFFIFGLSIFTYGDMQMGKTDWVINVYIAILVIILDLLTTINRYRIYLHLSKHGTLVENVKYTIIGDRHGYGISINYVLPNKGMKEFKSYRYPIEKSEVGKTGHTNILIDMKHPKYYYIFK